MCVSLPCYYYLRHNHESQISLYMHKDTSDETQPVLLNQERIGAEEVNPETSASSYEMAPIPTVSATPVHGRLLSGERPRPNQSYGTITSQRVP